VQLVFLTGGGGLTVGVTPAAEVDVGFLDCCNLQLADEARGPTSLLGARRAVEPAGVGVAADRLVLGP